MSAPTLIEKRMPNRPAQTDRPAGDPETAPPADAVLHGINLQNQGQEAAAEQVFRQHLSQTPNDPLAVYSLCVILMKQGKVDEALTWLHPCAAQHATFAPVWVAFGSALQAKGERIRALSAYEHALSIKPDYIEALINSGALLRETHQHARALDRFNKALELKPDHQNALGNCAILLTEFKKPEQAIAMFQRLLTINPSFDYGLGMLCYERMHICDWTDFDTTRDTLIEGVRAERKACKSLAFMALSDDAADHQTCARTFAQRFPAMPAMWQGERYRHERIRVAYLSADLREHPVGHLMAGIFEHHDKSRFETIAISIGVNDKSRLRGRMEAAFEHFIDARALNTRDIAQQIRNLEVDIVIDLGGYTSDSRSDVLAWRPAPAQVNYLGYPGTMGLPYVDYLIADRHVIPPEHLTYYDEKVVYLPDAYLPTDASIQIATETPSRADCGLPEDAVVFCSFNHDYKISPHIFDVWMRVLKAVPGSVLWLMSRNEYSQRNLRAHAQARGVDPDRLVFAKRVPRVEDHLARYRQADLFLDTHPYNAHTTAADALMSGLPVLTYMGQAFPARVAGSLLHTMGLPDLITHSLADYEAKAIEVANSPELRQQLRERLAHNRQHSALFDTRMFCRHLEAIYTSIWRQQQLGGIQDELGS